MKEVLIYEDNDGVVGDQEIIRVEAICPCGHKFRKSEWFVGECPECKEKLIWRL